MASARLSPTANLLRKSRLFSLPQALKPPQDPPTSKAVFESDTATLPHPVRASIATPSSSLARGDWGLKRPLPAKSTSAKSSKPVVRVNALDTFEHVTDFESAADHTMTLEKFQELNMPISLPTKVNYSSSLLPNHQSPFESSFDNTDTSKDLSGPGAKQFRHSGPWLAGQTEAEFHSYLEKVRRRKPELMQKLREHVMAKRTAERRKAAQDNGEDLENLEPVNFSEEDFKNAVKALRADPAAFGPVIFDLLDLPSPPAVPNIRMGHKYFQSPGTKLSAPEYAMSGPPRTHPSAGLSYMRSHASLYNHPKFGPQSYQRPVQARILRPKGRFKGRTGRAIAGIGGITVEDLNSMNSEQGSAPGLAYFDSSITGGAKYWVNPVRAWVDSEGRIDLASFRATATSRAPYGVEEQKRDTSKGISDVARGTHRDVPRLDSKRRWRNPDTAAAPQKDLGDVTKNLMDTLRR